MKCQFCSNEIDDHAIICRFCYKAIGSIKTRGETKVPKPYPDELDDPSSQTHHTSQGIASFVIGLITTTYLIFAYIFLRTEAGSQMDPIPAAFTMAAFCITLAMGNLLGIYLGIEGKKQNDKIFSRLGVWVNGIVLSIPLIYILAILLVFASVGI